MVMFIPTYPYLLSYLPIFLFIYAYSGSPISTRVFLPTLPTSECNNTANICNTLTAVFIRESSFSIVVKNSLVRLVFALVSSGFKYINIYIN